MVLREQLALKVDLKEERVEVSVNKLSPTADDWLLLLIGSDNCNLNYILIDANLQIKFIILRVNG